MGDDVRRSSAETRATGRGGDRATTDVEAGPALPDRLAAARERKGVDLFRAERDTKIRSRYLAALERGDYRELPGAVYTKGFLRNYAVYLGLDPEDVLRQWRRERGDQGPSEPAVVAPRTIVDPPRPLAFSPSVVVAALMTFGVILFGVYLAVQLLRFAKPPTLAVTNPTSAVIDVEDSATSFRLAGTATPGATVTVAVPGSAQPFRVTALSNGTWSVQVDLRRGTNQFDIDAVDPETGKPTETPQKVIIKVPYLVIQAPTLTVSQPQDGTTFENGAIPVEGTTMNAKEVTVAATYLGPPGSTVDVTPAPAATPAATPSLAPGATPLPSGAPPNTTVVKVADDGSFSTPLELTQGRWSITITATSSEGKTAALTRRVTVAYTGVNLVVTITGGDAWLKVWVDGALDPSTPSSGRVFSNGRTLTFTGKTSVEVRTGSSGYTNFTLNGVTLGALGKSGTPETWLFQPPAAPELTQHR
ncbi:MAG: helix-turn-helix domain-containing protein [Chloroflexi bacterium]|nr:helix-turn-helix domain-containing protein [Chloroflexota bacterium]